uniref:Uncharacterized protein n=1 Tax=Arundo donax TaxID=35708 RepID=A0A0A8XVQ2_ARUDO
MILRPKCTIVNCSSVLNDASRCIRLARSQVMYLEAPPSLRHPPRAATPHQIKPMPKQRKREAHERQEQADEEGLELPVLGLLALGLGKW